MIVQFQYLPQSGAVALQKEAFRTLAGMVINWCLDEPISMSTSDLNDFSDVIFFSKLNPVKSINSVCLTFKAFSKGLTPLLEKSSIFI